VPRARRDDQKIIGYRPFVEVQDLARKVYPSGLGELHLYVFLMAQNPPNRHRDVAWVERSGRDLIKEWLKEVVVSPIDECNLHGGPRERSGRIQAAEAAPHDHDTGSCGAARF
jgi:hypothetical protein